MGKAKKWVVCLGYSGRGYYGMQTQRRYYSFVYGWVEILIFFIPENRDNKVVDDLPTIESELLKAFLQTELINENEYHSPSLMYFQRAARTDKGVSALKQIISMNSSADLKLYLPKINEKLPNQIRIFGAKRSTKYFDSKNFCDCRTYSYLMPSFTIGPNLDESYRVSNEMIEKFNFFLSVCLSVSGFDIVSEFVHWLKKINSKKNKKTKFYACFNRKSKILCYVVIWWWSFYVMYACDINNDLNFSIWNFFFIIISFFVIIPEYTDHHHSVMCVCVCVK